MKTKNQDIKLTLTPCEAEAVLRLVRARTAGYAEGSGGGIIELLGGESSFANIAAKIEHAPLKKLEVHVKNNARQIALLTKKIDLGGRPWREVGEWYQLRETLLKQQKEIVAERNALRKTLFPPYHGGATA
jgi:hypothetical protein